MVRGSIVKNLCLVSIIYKNKKISFFPKNLEPTNKEDRRSIETKLENFIN